MTESGMWLATEGETGYSAGIADYVAVPVPTAAVIHVVWEGDILATAYRQDYDRYTNTDDVIGTTLLYRDWQECLRDQLGGTPDDELDELFSEGWA